MCFHAQQKHDSKTVQKRFNAKGPVSQGIYNGFSHPQLTVICASQPSELRLFNWGLIPYWAKETSIQQYTLNARLETLDEKPSFKSAKRCLVIADGFYEWQWLDSKGRKKQKHLIQLHDKSLFAFAGLWDEWVDSATGDIHQTVSIVTTAAEGIMRQIHNSKLRMPLLLYPKEEALWLDGASVTPQINLLTTAI